MSMPEQTGVYPMPPVWVADPADPPPVSWSLHSSSYDIAHAAEKVIERTVAPGIAASVARDGLTMFEIDNAHQDFSGDGVDVFPAVSARAALVNSYQAILHGYGGEIGLPVWEKVPVAHRSLVHGDADQGGVVRYRANEELVRYLYAVPNRRVIGPAAGTWVHVKDGWVPSRRVLPPNLVDGALTRLAELYRLGGPEALRRYELMFASCAALESRDMDTSIVLSWALVESSVSRIWLAVAQEINSSGAPTPKSVTSSLAVAPTTALLRMTGTLAPSWCEEIDTLRKARNSWLHEMQPTTRESAEGCLDLAGRLLAVADQTSFVVQLSSGVMGVVL